MTSPHVVLSFFSTRPVEGLLDNHRAYAARYGYTHRVMDSTHIWGERQPALYRMHALAHQLLKVPEGALLLVLDEFAVVYEPWPMDAVFEGLDSFVAAQADNNALSNFSLMALRNTAAVREKLRLLVLAAAQWACRIGAHVDEPLACLVAGAFTPHPCALPLVNGLYPNIQAHWPSFSYQGSLPGARPLAANCAPHWAQREGRWLAETAYDFRGVVALLEEVRCVQAGLPLPHLTLAQAPDTAAPDELHLNPDAPIAFVSLYTSHVANYGRIHERNFIRYCQRHGYGYHLYRSVPRFAGNLSGSWAKAHVMRRHLPEHEFLFWIDADVLVMDQSLIMEPLVEGREALVGTDHTAWAMKSGMVGLRRTPAMIALIDDLCGRMERVEDRSSVHVGGGDQSLFNWAFDERHMIDEACVVDSLTLDASPIYATRASHLVHFPTQPNEYRAVAMSVWERWSLEDESAARSANIDNRPVGVVNG